MNYDKRSYIAILESGIHAGYEFVSFLDVDIASKARIAILRHDIDFSPALALEMAEIDASYGINATFAVLPSSPLYNPFSPSNLEVIQQIHALGHHIALHHRAGPPRKDEQTAQDIQNEMRTLNAFFPYTQPVFVWHNIPPGGLARLSQMDVPGLVNAYGPKFIQEMYYMSDSVTRRTPEEILHAIGEHRLLHVLLHPLIWMSERENMVTMISYALTRMVRDCDAQLQNPAWRKRFPNGIPQLVLDRFEELLNIG